MKTEVHYRLSKWSNHNGGIHQPNYDQDGLWSNGLDVKSLHAPQPGTLTCLEEKVSRPPATNTKVQQLVPAEVCFHHIFRNLIQDKCIVSPCNTALHRMKKKPNQIHYLFLHCAGVNSGNILFSHWQGPSSGSASWCVIQHPLATLTASRVPGDPSSLNFPVGSRSSPSRPQREKTQSLRPRHFLYESSFHPLLVVRNVGGLTPHLKWLKVVGAGVRVGKLFLF